MITDQEKNEINPTDTHDALEVTFSVTPAQAVEMNKLAENIKMGYALLAMKQLNVTFDEEESNKNADNEAIDINAEEQKLKDAVESYKSFLNDCGVKNGTKDFEHAMELLGFKTTDMKDFVPPEHSIPMQLQLPDAVIQKVPSPKPPPPDEKPPVIAPPRKLSLIERPTQLQPEKQPSQVPTESHPQTEVEVPKPAIPTIVQEVAAPETLRRKSSKNLLAHKPHPHLKSAARKPRTSVRTAKKHEEDKNKHSNNSSASVQIKTWNFEPQLPSSLISATTTSDSRNSHGAATHRIQDPFANLNNQSVPAIQRQALRMAIARRMQHSPAVSAATAAAYGVNWNDLNSSGRQRSSSARTSRQENLLPNILQSSIKKAKENRGKHEENSKKEGLKKTKSQTPGQLKLPDISNNATSRHGSESGIVLQTSKSLPPINKKKSLTIVFKQD